MKHFLSFFLLLTSLATGADAPNVIFILTDDQRDNSFSAMGHPWIKTPHVDELLSRGTRFQNAYIAEPTCKPSRAAIYLGCHERVNRQGFSSKGTMNAAQWADSFPALLQKAGYYTGFVGKWHISNAKGLALDELFDVVDGHIGHGPFFFSQDDRSELTTNRHHTNNALRFFDAVPEGTPFMLSLCYATPHGSKISKTHNVLEEPAHRSPKLKGHPIYGSQYRHLTFPIPIDQAPKTWFSAA
ncbi:MAG: sulfatase-like hydrolase/transferase [Verrucomicrobiota bacterium]